MKIRTLFLSANPVGTGQLQLDEEIRAITEKIRSAEHRDVIELVSAWAVRPDDLLQLLNQYKPQIVHFSGHGSSAGELVLVDNTGTSKPVSTNAIRYLFKTLKDNISLVVLNACYSRTQAQAIIETIDCAVGMNTVIGDKAAIIFAASFYRALGFGRSVQEAFDQGKTALLLEGIPEENTPDLLCRAGINASQIFIVVSDNQQEKEPPEIQELAEYRTEGVRLRNLGEGLTDSSSLTEWIKDYTEWDKNVLNTLSKLSKAKSEWLRTLDRMPIQPGRKVINPEHLRYLSIFDEKLKRLDMILRRYLDLL